MYFPKREEKILTLPKYKEKSIDNENMDNESVIIEEEEIQEFLTEKKKLKAEIDRKLKPALENITISQINRFYSILESRNFSLDSNYIKSVIDKQIERKIIDEEKIEDFEKEKNFYKLFKENFLTENFFNDRKRCFILMNLIKSYVKYYIGNQRIEEKREKRKEA